jgi:hypothetical protein
MVCRALLFCLILSPLGGCMSTGSESTLATSGARLPVMQWDHRPEAQDWTTRTLVALEQQDSALATAIPADIAVFCPGYESASLDERRAFWAGLMSAVARYESSWNPQASGGGGRYLGVMQISPTTAGHHGCAADSASELKDGAANLVCATQIVAAGVARDGVVAGPGNRGAGRDWMPFRNAEKRAAIAAWTTNQSYCAL